MRVISGSAKHRTLVSSSGAEMQPTIDRVKCALFSKLQFELEGRRVLDLFAGSGQLGIEALSRGAKFCDFVDTSKASLDAIRRNITSCGFNGVSAVHAVDAEAFIKSAPTYDIIFMDPPFHGELIHRILPAVVKKCLPSGVIYCETAEDELMPSKVGDFVRWDSVRYGYILTTYYRHRDYGEEK